jgi:hypothetical protein
MTRKQIITVCLCLSALAIFYLTKYIRQDYLNEQRKAYVADSTSNELTYNFTQHLISMRREGDSLISSCISSFLTAYTDNKELDIKGYQEVFQYYKDHPCARRVIDSCMHKGCLYYNDYTKIMSRNDTCGNGHTLMMIKFHLKTRGAF